ncbi:MAG: PKD domain-containing protein [Thermoanaerobaculales bacterium]|nr:PKD domain-containing protein [Thermoanaerobaculales bacterium]
MRNFLIIAIVFTSFAAAGPSGAQTFCDGPPTASFLTNQSIVVSGMGSEGHPSSLSWYITPPDASVPGAPTSQEAEYELLLDSPGLWSIALVADYDHEAVGGGRWSSDLCVTVKVSTVVAAISLGAAQVTTEENLPLHGHDSLWATGVAPEVEWRIDGQPLAACNGGPAPSTPLDLNCTVPSGWLDPGTHTAGLLLTDPGSGESSFALDTFEVTEVVPLSVDFSWHPFEPDPGVSVNFTAVVEPFMDEADFTLVEWDFGDGAVVSNSSCPLPWASCLAWPHAYGLDGWYDITVTVETEDETASATHRIKVGDPVEPPVASFSATSTTPSLYEAVALDFDGTCEGACQWSWSFDDGTFSSTEDTVHAWELPNTYAVTLTVTNQSGSDAVEHAVTVGSCWTPISPTQSGSCFGGPVSLTGAFGNAWRWSTGEQTRVISAPFEGEYWVNVDDGAGCWGYSTTTVVLSNCGDPDGDTNLDGAVDAADLAALIPELTDGDGDTVVGAGGGDLTAPGGDVTGEGLLRADDLLSVVVALFE